MILAATTSMTWFVAAVSQDFMIKHTWFRIEVFSIKKFVKFLENNFKA